MRSLSLALALKDLGHDVVFFCADLPGNIAGQVESAGFNVHMLPNVSKSHYDFDEVQDAGFFLDEIASGKYTPHWVVIDHYDIGDQWHDIVAGMGALIAVIDDLANRKLSCDLLVDQNQIASIHARYDALVQFECRKLLGPEYTLLRPEFRHVREHRDRHKAMLSREGFIIVFLGGADNQGLTLRVIRSCQELFPEETLHVLTGSMNSYKNAITEFCDKHDITCSVGHIDIGTLLPRSKAAIIACGMFAVELQAMDIPSLLVPLSDIQETVADFFVRNGKAVKILPDELEVRDKFYLALQSVLVFPEKTGTDSPIPLDGPFRIASAMQELHICQTA